jgi:branched-chain amino acid transport system ATP-binding protein
MEKPVILEVHNLVVKYGLASALQGVSGSVDEGSCLLVVGPNGAGKSTLFRTMSGLVNPTEGRILFQGREIQGHRPDTIVKMGLVHCPERRRLFSGMSVIDNLRLGAFLTKDKNEFRDDLEAVFKWFPVLKERSRQVAGTLSGGEQQMLAIGRALMSRPKLLLLDEPSLGLSLKMKETIFARINEICKSPESPLTTILVEQDVLTPSKIADEIYVLTAGKVVAQGKPNEILSNKDFIATYLGTDLK